VAWVNNDGMDKTNYLEVDLRALEPAYTRTKGGRDRFFAYFIYYLEIRRGQGFHTYRSERKKEERERLLGIQQDLSDRRGIERASN